MNTDDRELFMMIDRINCSGSVPLTMLYRPPMFYPPRSAFNPL